MLAWVQANLINIHIPRGKPRLTVEKVRGKRAAPVTETRSDEEIREQASEMAEAFMPDPEARERARDRRLQRRAMREADAAFWASAEGDRLAAQVSAYDDD